MNDDDLGVLFRCVSRNLKSKGLFVFDHYMFSKKWAEAHNDVDVPMFKDVSKSIVDTYRYDFNNNVMRCDVKCNGKVVTSFDFRWFRPENIRSVFENDGFICQILYGDFDNSPWMPDSPNQIWVLRKGA